MGIYLSSIHVRTFSETDAIAYDTQGRPTSVTEDGITTTYAYDSAGRVATETRTTAAGTLVRTWTYSSAGLPTGSTVEEV